MLPKFLRSSYKEYKADTDLVLDWLARTARDRGFSEDGLRKDSVTSVTSKSRSHKPKPDYNPGKENRSKIDTHRNTTPEKTQRHPRREAAVSTFLRSAEFIAKAEPKPEVPLYVWATLRKAIDIRQNHNTWHMERGKDNAGSRNANESHGHFIDVLKKVATILEPLHDDSDGESDESMVKSGYFSVDAEPTTEREAMLKEKIESQIRVARESIEFTVIRDDRDVGEEARFAWQCLLMDFHALKGYVDGLWTAYKHHNLDLMEVSVVSNTAIEFAKTLDDEFSSTFPHFEPIDMNKCFTGKFLLYCEAVAGSEVVLEQASQDLIFDAYEKAERGFLPTQGHLLGFCEILQQGDWSRSVPLTYDKYDAASDRSQKSAEEKFVEDRTIFHETLMELFFLATAKDLPFAEDEITRGIRQLTDTTELSMWLIFAFQIFLDIRHILRDDISRGWQDLQKAAGHIRVGIKQVLAYHDNPKDRQDGLIDHGLLQHTLKAMETWLQIDIVDYVRSRTFGRMYPGHAKPPPFFLFKRHPLRCGLMAYALQTTSQNNAINLVNSTGSILFAAHLYNAVRQESFLNLVWEDMNLALHFHKTETLFLGNFPSKPADYFKRYHIAMGSCSGVDFVKRARKQQWKPTPTKDGIRKLNRISPVSMMFWDRFCQPQNQISFSPDDIEKILRETGNGTMKHDGVALSDKLDFSARQYQDHVASSKQDKYDLNLTYTFKARSVILLDALLSATKSEAPQLAFNHFMLHVSSARLLRAVEEAVADDLKTLTGFVVSHGLGSPPMTVGMIIIQALEAGVLHDSLRIPKEEIDSYQPLVRAAEAIETLLSSGSGGIECLMLKKLGMAMDVADILHGVSE